MYRERGRQQVLSEEPDLQYRLGQKTQQRLAARGIGSSVSLLGQ
jgi:hypothetical protein